jgi:hypothetical protein
MPTPLINDLLGGGIFRSGLLTERLESADLAHLEPEVQRRIGVAVGQRAMRETFVIRRDGIEECAERDAPEIWPTAYREGAFEGLFVNPHGQVHHGYPRPEEARPGVARRSWQQVCR